MSINRDGKKDPLLPSYQQGTTYGTDLDASVDLSRMYNNDTNPLQVINATGPDGLTDAECRSRLAQFGKNELPDNEESKLLKFLKGFTGPMPIMIWIAIIIEGKNTHISGSLQ